VLDGDRPERQRRAGAVKLRTPSPFKSKRIQTRTVSGSEFLWLVLQHVLPKGFRRARNFGFLHPNSKLSRVTQ